MHKKDIIAYFSMEIALEDGIPTYSGGLGVLAGDFLLTAADMKVPIVGVTLLHQRGYFFQTIDNQGQQVEEPDQWAPKDHLILCEKETTVEIRQRQVYLRIWRYDITSKKGFIVPVYFLDSNHPQNDPEDQVLCQQLYDDDPKVRLSQEVILGIGGLRLLDLLGLNVKRFHMNEGHAALLAMKLLEREMGDDLSKIEQACVSIRSKCVFTTHTPVPAGHDKFSLETARKILGNHPYLEVNSLLRTNQELNMTYVALNLSGYINGVAKRHGEVAKWHNAPYTVEAITNGVHVARWVSPSFAKLYDEQIPGWDDDNFSLRYASGIERRLVWEAHLTEKKRLIDFIKHEMNVALSSDAFTIGFARRATSYKRADLLFYDIDRLVHIAETVGNLQCVFAGKAHPKDLLGKQIIQRIFSIKQKLKDKLNIVYLSNYDTSLARLLVAGVDLWLNNPQRPLEASGTSGMKAALNGIPSLSILDGWWIEGCIEGITGWTIGNKGEVVEENNDQEDAQSIYSQLESKILPLFYQNQMEYAQVMRAAIALNGSFFNTQRMMQQYVLDAYF